MQKVTENMNALFEGGRYAHTEEELYEKAIALLDKCKIERPDPDREAFELESAVRAT